MAPQPPAVDRRPLGPNGRHCGSLWRTHSMRKPRPATYNPAQALQLISHDRHGMPLSCPSCSGEIVRDPDFTPPAPRSHVTLRCANCGRIARYIAGAA